MPWFIVLLLIMPQPFCNYFDIVCFPRKIFPSDNFFWYGERTLALTCSCIILNKLVIQMSGTIFLKGSIVAVKMNLKVV